MSVPGGVAVRIDVLGLVEARAHEDAHLVHHAELDRAHLQHLGAERGELQHFLERDLVEPLRLRHHARVGGVDAVDVGVDVAAVGLDRGGDRHRRGVGAAAAERGDAAGLLVDALEAGDHRDLLALLEALDQLGAVDVEDARRAMRVGGQDRQLPALPGARVDAHAFAARSPAGRRSPARRRRPRRRIRARRAAARPARHQATSSLVLPAMAETTTATSWPASTSRLTWRATLRMRSMSATDVPPNFITSRAMATDAVLGTHAAGAMRAASAGAKRRVYIPAGSGRCNRGAALSHPAKAGNGRKSRSSRSPSARSTRPRSSGFPRWPPSGGTRAARWRRCTSSIRCGSAISATRRPRVSAAIRSGSTAWRACACSTSAAAAASCREPLARLGATVVGVDPSRDQHRGGASSMPRRAGLAIDYRCTTAEALADAGERFDIVLAMEVVEHVADVPLFVRRCAEMVKPGGLMIAATLNRTLKSFALAIVGAEYILRWLPRRHPSLGQVRHAERARDRDGAGRAARHRRAGRDLQHPFADGWQLSDRHGRELHARRRRRTADAA